MPIFLMMMVTLHEVIGVIAVGYGLVPAICAVNVIYFMSNALMAICAIRRVCVVDLEAMLIDVSVMRRVQVTIMQLVGVIVVNNRGMAAILAMFVKMIRMDFVGFCYGEFPYKSVRCCAVLGENGSVLEVVQRRGPGHFELVPRLAAWSDVLQASEMARGC